jgi:hypothetical protein
MERSAQAARTGGYAQATPQCYSTAALKQLRVYTQDTAFTYTSRITECAMELLCYLAQHRQVTHSAETAGLQSGSTSKGELLTGMRLLLILTLIAHGPITRQQYTSSSSSTCDSS